MKTFYALFGTQEPLVTDNAMKFISGLFKTFQISPSAYMYYQRANYAERIIKKP